MQLLKTKLLAAGACLFGGLLAGVTANRALVELPAWQRVGAIEWAGFSRAENHGAGAFFYLIIGFLALLFTVTTSIAVRLDHSAKGFRRFPAYAAATLAVTYAAITRAILVPAAFHLRDAGNNGSELQQIFASVTRWWGVNDLLHVLAFGLSLWAFAEILGGAARQS
jgi:hypothetical protein